MPFLTPNQEVKTLKETQSTVLTLFFGNFIRQLALADTHSQELEDFCFTAHMPLLSATSTFKQVKAQVRYIFYKTAWSLKFA